MTSCVFPGSFDPVTKGHFDLISRAAVLFDHVTVTVMNNIHKSGTFSVASRISMLKKICADLPNVSVEKWDGLLVDYMKKKGEKIILRGIRGCTELDQELQACAANRMLNNGIETIFLPCNPSMNGISSSAVREIALFGGNIQKFVPEVLVEEIKSCLSKE